MVRLRTCPSSATFLIVVVVGAVVHVGQLSLEAVEPLPVVDGDGNGEAHDEDGHNDPDRSSRTSTVLRSAQIWRRG